MNTTKGRRLLVGLLVAAVVALVAAVMLTEREDEVDVDALLADVPGAVEELRRAHVDLSVQVEQEGFDVAITGTGTVDLVDGAGWFSIDALGTSIETRTNGETLFVRPSGDTTWLAVHADEASGVGPFGAGAPQAIALVDLLRGDVEDVEDRGPEEVAGRDARHLQLRVDLDAAASAVEPERRPAIEALRTLARDGVLPVDVWIDDRNLPVRQLVRGELRGVAVVLTVDLTGWGDDLGVAIPPEGAVRDIEADELPRIFGGPLPG